MAKVFDVNLPLCEKCGGIAYLETWDSETEARHIKCSSTDCSNQTGPHWRQEDALGEWINPNNH